MSGKTIRTSIAIIGGSGFVGSSLAKHLTNHFCVTVLDRRPPQNFGGSFRICDVRDLRSLTEALHGFDLVVNTAIIQVPEISENKRYGYEVNVMGTQNICEAVEHVESVKGMLHSSSWHVFGERYIRGTLDEEFGYRPDKVEQRAKLYALCKIGQETVIRILAEMSSKCYGIIRLGTVLGEAMPEQTAANIFIGNALKGKPITPFKHTQHRPMLYVDIQDVCKAFESFAIKILHGQLAKQRKSAKILNLFSPPPVTIIELAQMVRRKVVELTDEKIKPKIMVIDKGVKPMYRPRDKELFKVDTSIARQFLGLEKLTKPDRSIELIIQNRIGQRTFTSR